MFLSFALRLSAPGEANAQRPLLIGYFGQWGLYNEPASTLHDLAVNGSAGRLDQLNYAQAFVTGGRCSVADRNADLDHAFTAADSVSGQADDPRSPFRGYFHQLEELKAKYPHLRALISLEGRAADFSFDARPENREAFVASCIDLFLKGHLAPGVEALRLFDGIDVDWEYPQGADAENFLALLAEFRRQMDLVRPSLTLSIAVGPSPRMYQGSNFTAVAAAVDQVSLMTYDMAGPWMQTTGFIAPLYSVPGRPIALEVPAITSVTPPVQAAVPPPRGGVSGAVQNYLMAGVPREKLIVGVPFYGYGWTQVPEAADGLFQEGTPVRGDRPYSYIKTLAAKSRVYRDPVSHTPWLFDGDAFWTFDDPESVQAKAEFVVKQDLGGVMIWEVGNDTEQGELLTAARNGLRNVPTP